MLKKFLVVCLCIAASAFCTSAYAQVKTVHCVLTKYSNGDHLVYKLARVNDNLFIEVEMQKNGIVENNGARGEFWAESGSGTTYWFLTYARNTNYFLRGPQNVSLDANRRSTFEVHLFFMGQVSASGFCHGTY